MRGGAHHRERTRGRFTKVGILRGLEPVGGTHAECTTPYNASAPRSIYSRHPAQPCIVLLLDPSRPSPGPQPSPQAKRHGRQGPKWPPPYASLQPPTSHPIQLLGPYPVTTTTPDHHSPHAMPLAPAPHRIPSPPLPLPPLLFLSLLPLCCITLAQPPSRCRPLPRPRWPPAWRPAACCTAWTTC